jgi:hypothetical protein
MPHPTGTVIGGKGIMQEADAAMPFFLASAQNVELLTAITIMRGTDTIPTK